jgi:hypothetical protein
MRGNRQMFPVPTAMPSMATINPQRLEKLAWLTRTSSLEWGSAPHPGSVARGAPIAPLRSLAAALCAAPLTRH